MQERDTAAAFGNYTLVELLNQRVSELEKQLDDFAAIWEIESILDRTYSEVVTLRTQADRWGKGE